MEEADWHLRVKTRATINKKSANKAKTKLLFIEKAFQNYRKVTIDP